MRAEFAGLDGAAEIPGEMPDELLIERIMLVGRFEEGEYLSMFLRREICPHSHVERHDFPLGVTIRAGRPNVVTMPAVVGPHLGAALVGRSRWRGCSFIRRRGTAARFAGGGAAAN